jgi:hypothetical protein
VWSIEFFRRRTGSSTSVWTVSNSAGLSAFAARSRARARVGSLAWAAVACVMLGALGGCGGGSAPPPEPRPGTGSAAAIRTYLARAFLYEGWYANVGEIAVAGHTATVSAALERGRKSHQVADEVCTAVLSSHDVRKVIVRYESGSEDSCP